MTAASNPSGPAPATLPAPNTAPPAAPAAPTAATPARWNFKHVWLAWAVGVAVQGLFLPCLCNIGIATMQFSFIFDGLMLVRILVAWHWEETGRGWVFYTWLCYTSPLWIEGLTWLILGGR